MFIAERQPVPRYSVPPCQARSLCLHNDLASLCAISGVIWHKGPALTYVSPHEASVSAAHAACREGDADKLKSVSVHSGSPAIASSHLESCLAYCPTVFSDIA
eukprot:5665380-Pleurochrysis_carterae.AAC.1